MTIDQFLTNPSSIVCNCRSSPLKNSFYGHIITGGLRIVKDNKLRKLFTKGQKYQESRKIDFGLARENINDTESAFQHGIKNMEYRMLLYQNNLKKNFMAPFWMGFNCLKATVPLRRDTLLFTTTSPGVPGTHII